MTPVCFVISPIGDAGSPVRQNADDLLDFIIRPALEIFDFKVVRGDQRSEPAQIDVDVIQMVQEAELCICDITGQNPNVMYELGRRDETMKDIIVLKRVGEKLPVDLGSRRCIEYDLSTPRSAKEAQEQIRSFVEPMIARGFDSSGRAATLRDMMTMLDRLERKVDGIRNDLKSTPAGRSGPALAVSGGSEGLGGLTPMQAFRKAKKTQDVPLAELAMAKLEPTMDHLSFLDQIVEVVAAMGSDIAGNYLISCFREFMDSDMGVTQKMDYIAFLITYASMHDREPEIREQIETATDELLQTPDLTDRQRGFFYNQLNRIYYGMYCITRDDAWRIRAVTALHLAIEYDPQDRTYYYNLAMAHQYADLDAAIEAIEHCLALEKDDSTADIDHLQKAYLLFRRAEDPRSFDVLERIRRLNPDLADYLANYAT